MLLPLVALLLCLMAGGALAQEWPEWRGPKRDGSIAGVRLPEKWPERLNRKWSVPVGEGHSSPVVAEGRVYQFTRWNDQETVAAIGAADGRILWRESYPAPYEMNSAARSHGKGPKSTPVLHAGKLYTLGISGILTCFDAASGKRIWQKDFGKRFGNTSPLYGTAMSPIVYGETLIAHVGGDGGGALAAFDLATGKEVWAWSGDGPGYTSPIIAPLGGVAQLVTQTESKTAGFAPDTGKLLWEIPFTTPWEQNIVTPVVHEGKLILSGLSNPTFALQVKEAGGRWTTERLWSSEESSMYMSSPVTAEGRLAGFTNRNKGQLFLLDPASGEVTWKGKPRSGDNAALLIAGGVLLVLTTEGELTAARITESGIAVERTYSVADTPVWAHPAPVSNGFLVKDLDSLTRWEW